MILGQLATPARPPDRPAHDSLQNPDSPAAFLESGKGHAAHWPLADIR